MDISNLILAHTKVVVSDRLATLLATLLATPLKTLQTQY